MTRGKLLFWTVAVLLLAPVTYFLLVFNWSYADGERAGWVQKLSDKGWVCKTWEGEMAMVSMPGTMSEKFNFTILDDAVAEQVKKLMGKRVSVYYEEKVGLPTSCFGDTRYYVKKISLVEEAPGTAPTPPPPPAATKQ